MNENYKSGNVLIMLDSLPPFIQKGSKLCNLSITKWRNDYIIAYSNAKEHYLVHGIDIEDVLKRMIERLKNPPSDKYIINLNWHLE